MENNKKQEFSKEEQIHLFHGPQHPGVTGNMSVELWFTGDTVNKAKTHVGYLHRGFEKLMEKRLYIQSVPLVCRICVPEPDINEENFSRAVEELAGIEVPEKAKWIRMMVLEMARLGLLIMTMGGQAGIFGLGTAPQWAYGDRDYIVDLFEELTGGRIYHIYITPGGVRRNLPKNFKKKVLKVLKYIESRLPAYDNLIFNNSVFKTRAKNIGVIPKEWVEEMCIVGTNARAGGFPYDVRKETPYENYDKIEYDLILGNHNDVFTRALLRRKEIEQTINILRQIIDLMPENGEVYNPVPNPLNWKVPAGEVYVKIESTRGEYGYYMVSDGTEKPRRVQVKGPSYIHATAVLERLLEGANIADVGPIMVSLQTCPPEIER